MSPDELDFYRELHAQCQVAGYVQSICALVFAFVASTALGWIIYRVVWPTQSMWFWKNSSLINLVLWVLALVGSCAFAYLWYLGHDAAVCFEIRYGLNLYG